VRAVATEAFFEDLEALSPDDRRRFQHAAQRLMAGLLHNPSNLSKSLLVNQLRGTVGMYVMSWSAAGRATFSVTSDNNPNITWQRIARHHTTGGSRPG
jgi:hypothetical protein